MKGDLYWKLIIGAMLLYALSIMITNLVLSAGEAVTVVPIP